MGFANLFTVDCSDSLDVFNKVDDQKMNERNQLNLNSIIAMKKIVLNFIDSDKLRTQAPINNTKN